MPIHLAPRLPTEARQAEIVAAALQLAREASPPLITMVEIAAVAAAGVAQPLQALEAVFEAHLGFVSAHPGVPRVIFHELQNPQDSAVKREVRTLMQSYRALLLRLLRAAAQRGDVAAGVDPDAAATLFIGTVQGLVMQAMSAGRPRALAAGADAVFAVFLRGIRRT